MSKAVVVLIAAGANNLAIPCRVFQDMKEGYRICNEIFKCSPKPVEWCKEPIWEYNPGAVEIKQKRDAYGRQVTKSANHEGQIAETLFTGFYFGCGGPYAFYLKEVEFNTRFVRFDLD